MNLKKLPLIMIAVFLSLLFAANWSWAGNVQRNRWEGVAIGIGAAILGSALINQHRYSPPPPATACYPTYRETKPKRYHRPPPKYGYWEIRKEWVPPIYRRVWNPGHYTPRGKWVPAGWIEIVDRPGFWEERRVRVSRR